MAKKNYSIVRQRIERLCKQAEEMEKEAVDALVSAMMTPGVKEKLAALSRAELQAVAKNLSAQVTAAIAAVQAERKLQE